MRDAESLLDQVIAFADGKVGAEDVRAAVGLADDAAIAALVDAYAAGDPAMALDGVAALADAGRDLAQVAAQAEEEARRRLLASAADPRAARAMASILRSLAEAAGAGAREGRARLALELLAVEASSGVTTTPLAVAPPAAVAAATAPPRPASTPPRPAPAATRTEPPATDGERSADVTPPATVAPAVADALPADVADLRARWAEVVERASPVLKPLLKECRPVARDGARLTLAFPEGRDFMRSRIVQRAAAIESLLSQMFGGAFAIECVASNLELEPLTVEQAIGTSSEDPEARALIEGVLKITGGELVDAPEVR
jgi:DNA polymerase-3 subunit gamma/tau